MTEETTTGTRKSTSRAKVESIDLSSTSSPWLKASGVKVCGECGEKLCTRQGADGKAEIFCPANKKDCAFVKIATS
jgi:hypothetical protein